MMKATAEKTNVQRLPEVRIIEYRTMAQGKEGSERGKCPWLTNQDRRYIASTISVPCSEIPKECGGMM